jgi:hypothetical protein
MSQSQQVQIDELSIKNNCILSTQAVRQNSSGPEGCGMKGAVLANEAKND